ncbi:TPA: ISAs1 family transposase [Candidatus Komeilibacteria bacterium]|nr:MAG: hypothetical protein A3J95_01190 [Candidatus Komeilibacteria bacterium RIFOXYC2_FULL_45_12]HAH04565.1 ISAs1 family transposase [Candidatus Komeilibacteria bacterium]HCC74004.1 ISAs1 family transposase [Candidatus Komeilibacteria bacterium]
MKTGKPKSVYTHTEKNRGRIEERTVKVYDNLKNIDPEWVGLKTLIMVRRKTITKTKRTKETAYFISSLPPTANAKIFYEGIRSHWRIENGLHYVKDVTFKEDQSRIRTGNSPQNKSLIIDIIINIFRKNNYTNMAQAIRLVGNDIKLMWKMIIA